MEKKNTKWSTSWDTKERDKGRNFSIWSNGWDIQIATTHGNQPNISTPPT
jgi:hypothetical protein